MITGVIREALSEVFGPIDGSLFNELVDIVRVLRDWRNAHAPPIVDPVAATKSTTASKTDAPTTTTTTSTTDRLTIEYAHDVRFTFQPVPILLERGNQGTQPLSISLSLSLSLSLSGMNVALKQRYSCRLGDRRCTTGQGRSTAKDSRANGTDIFIQQERQWLWPQWQQRQQCAGCFTRQPVLVGG